MRRRVPSVLLCGVLAVSLAACGNPIAPSLKSATVAVIGVKVAPQAIQFDAVGQTRQITATVAPLNATDQAVTWESTDPSIASVDDKGLVTARAVGFNVFVTVYTHDGRFQASVAVNVNP